MTWLLDTEPLDPEKVVGYVGFVYLITNKATGKKYIGKKLLTKARTRGPLKGRKRKRRDRVESDWKDYFGSNKDLLADVEKYGRDKFRREVLRLCKTRGECSYWEAHYQFGRSVLLFPDEWYNHYIYVRVHRTHLPRN